MTTTGRRFFMTHGLFSVGPLLKPSAIMCTVQGRQCFVGRIRPGSSSLGAHGSHQPNVLSGIDDEDDVRGSQSKTREQCGLVSELGLQQVHLQFSLSVIHI